MGGFDINTVANGFTPAQLNGMVSNLGSAASTIGNLISSGSIGSGSGTGATPAFKSAHNSELYAIYVKSQTDLSNASIDLSRAEKNYYVYNGGQNGGGQKYNKLIIDRFAKTADQFKKNSIEMQQEFMANLSQSIKQYQAEVTFQGQSAKLLKLRRKENDDLIKNIDYYNKIVQTSERKVVYENKNMDSLYMYRRIMVFIYYAAIVCFIVFGNFIPEQLYFKYSVWLIIVIACIFPLILNMMVKWSVMIYEMLSYWFSGPDPFRQYRPHYTDVYKNLGNPADEAPPASDPFNSLGGLT